MLVAGRQEHLESDIPVVIYIFQLIYISLVDIDDYQLISVGQPIDTDRQPKIIPAFVGMISEI